MERKKYLCSQPQKFEIKGFVDVIVMCIRGTKVRWCLTVFNQEDAFQGMAARVFNSG